MVATQAGLLGQHGVRKTTSLTHALLTGHLSSYFRIWIAVAARHKLLRILIGLRCSGHYLRISGVLLSHIISLWNRSVICWISSCRYIGGSNNRRCTGWEWFNASGVGTSLIGAFAWVIGGNSSQRLTCGLTPVAVGGDSSCCCILGDKNATKI